LEEAIAGSDVCFSTLGGGSLSKRAPWFTDGISRIVSVMEKEGVSRFVDMSSIGAGESRFFMGPVLRFLITGLMLRVPLADHSVNEECLRKSNLLWTIVRPASLTNGARSAKSKHGSDFIKLSGNPKISRAEVASFMLDQAVNKGYVKKGVWLFD
jgi:putative NADH-flavin reductase